MADPTSYPLYPPTKLDERQIFQGAYDEPTQRIRTESIATISNVSIDVDLDPSEDGVYIADKDTGNELKINTDGSINVNFNAGNIASIYAEVTGIATGVTTIISQVTVTQAALLQKIEFSGTNIAEFELVIDGSTEDKQRTYFGSSLNGKFDFGGGLSLTVGQIVTIYVIHNRPDLGDFNCRSQFLEA